MSLTWERPKSDGGGRILGYYIEKRDANADNWVRVNTAVCPSNIYNITGLIEDREYNFRVIAVNEAGESSPTETSRKIKVRDPKGDSIRDKLISEIQLFRNVKFINFDRKIFFSNTEHILKS